MDDFLILYSGVGDTAAFAPAPPAAIPPATPAAILDLCHDEPSQVQVQAHPQEHEPGSKGNKLPPHCISVIIVSPPFSLIMRTTPAPFARL